MTPLLNKTLLPDGRRAIILRTSDRAAFKRCRRAWGWSSHLKGNLGSSNWATPLWFGSAIHFALEDFYGYKRYESASDAFRAFCIASAKQTQIALPSDSRESFELGVAMLDYYENVWLKLRGDRTTTYWEKNSLGVVEPQVEVPFEIEVPLDEFPKLQRLLALQGADCLLYRGTLDRVTIDKQGSLWVQEYKTAKTAETLHFQTDAQIRTYAWAARHIYQRPVAGVCYVQFVKSKPIPPRILANGRLSTAANQVTSAALYGGKLAELFGSVEKSPRDLYDHYLELLSKEDMDQDRFIQRSYIDVNIESGQSEAIKILLEAEDILNPDLALYPNPTRDCARMCPWLGPCVAFDEGSDWESILRRNYTQRDDAFADPKTYWRRRLPSAELLGSLPKDKVPALEEAQDRISKLSPEEQYAIAAGEADFSFTFE